MSKTKLALYGGELVRKQPIPPSHTGYECQFIGEEDKKSVLEALDLLSRAVHVTLGPLLTRERMRNPSRMESEKSPKRYSRKGGPFGFEGGNPRV